MGEVIHLQERTTNRAFAVALRHSALTPDRVFAFMRAGHLKPGMSQLAKLIFVELRAAVLPLKVILACPDVTIELAPDVAIERIERDLVDVLEEMAAITSS